MSEFSPAWLDRREPADRLAHSLRVLDAMAAHFAGREKLNICDLGAGTGVTVRALHERLRPKQHWTLVDYAADNLAAAESRLAPVMAANPQLRITSHQADLAAEHRVWADDTDLITASALFDLTSPAWIEQFVQDLAGRPLLALLTYDGRLRFSHRAPEDEVMVAAFNGHQQTDKGFGPAAGPDAAKVMHRALEAGGYDVIAGDSSWYLGENFPAMRQDVMDGWAKAAAEMRVAPDVIARWRAAHADPTDRLVVGHTDLWAIAAG